MPDRSLAKKRNGDVIKGYYHKMKQDLYTHVIQELQGKLEQWEAHCFQNNLSCGYAMQAMGSGEGADDI